MALRLVNRILLTLVGLLLFAGGGAAIAVALGAFGADRAGQPVLSAASLARREASDWWWPVLVGVLSAVFLAGLGWLVAQVGRGRRRLVGLAELDESGGSAVRSRAVADVLSGAFEDLPGVDRADVRLAGRRRAPGVRVSLTLTALARPGELAGDAISGPVADLRRSLARPDLPVEIVMRPRAREAVRDAPRVE
jgi:hypothetical protein